MSRPAAMFMLVKALLLFLILSAAAAGDGGRGDSSGEAGPTPELFLDLDSVSTPAQSTLLNGIKSRLGIGFSLGLFYFSDQQSSLSNTFSQSTVTLQDPFSGSSSTTVLDNDPKLNNSKFDFELDFRGVGIFSTLELARIPRLGVASLVCEIAETDVTFDVFDTTAQSSLSSSFDGNGFMYGVGFDVSSDLAARWSADWGYRYRNLTNIEVNREVSIGPASDVLMDDVSFSRESHEFASRFFYDTGLPDLEFDGGLEGSDGWFSPWRYRPYAGALFRRTEVEIDDRIWFLDGFELMTDQETVSRFDSDVVQAIVGVEGRWSSIVASLESFFGGSDQGVRFQVGWSNAKKQKVAENSKEDRQRAKEERRQWKKEKRRQNEVLKRNGGAMLNRLIMAEKLFERGIKNLTIVQSDAGSGDAYLAGEIGALVDTTEENVRDAICLEAMAASPSPGEDDAPPGGGVAGSRSEGLCDPGLEPMISYMRLELDRVRDRLRLAAGAQPSTTATAGRPSAFVTAGAAPAGRSMIRLAMQKVPSRGTVDQEETETAFSVIRSLFPIFHAIIEKRRCRWVTIVFDAEIANDKTSPQALLYPLYSAVGRKPKYSVGVGEKGREVVRGAYRYEIHRGQDKPIVCSFDDKDPGPCPMRLVDMKLSKLVCSIESGATDVAADSACRHLLVKEIERGCMGD